jgi:hypothetical protein
MTHTVSRNADTVGFLYTYKSEVSEFFTLVA